MSALRPLVATVVLAAAGVFCVAAPAAAGTAQVFLRAGAEPQSGDVTTWAYGTYGDRHLLCDWDGDGDATIAVHRPSDGTWHVRSSNGGGAAQVSFRYGRPGDEPLCGDWDGDGRDTPGAFRAANGTWHLRNTVSAGPADITYRFGRPGSEDVALVGDWNADGTDTPGVFRVSARTWLLRDANSSGPANRVFTFGRTSDAPVVGDWDGDGRDTPGVFRGSDRRLYLRVTGNGGPAQWRYPFGGACDVPLAGDWDRDGRDEPALARAFQPGVAPHVSLLIRRAETGYDVLGAVTPARSVPVRLVRLVDGQPVGVAATRSTGDGRYDMRLQHLDPGTYAFQVRTLPASELGAGQSPVRELVVPPE